MTPDRPHDVRPDIALSEWRGAAIGVPSASVVIITSVIPGVWHEEPSDTVALRAPDRWAGPCSRRRIERGSSPPPSDRGSSADKITTPRDRLRRVSGGRSSCGDERPALWTWPTSPTSRRAARSSRPARVSSSCSCRQRPVRASTTGASCSWKAALSRCRRRRGRRGAEEVDLTPPLTGLLRAVATGPGRSQQEIATQLGTPPARMVALVDDLDQRGLVERKRNPDDRRLNALYLTDVGRNMLTTVGRIAAPARRRPAHSPRPHRTPTAAHHAQPSRRTAGPHHRSAPRLPHPRHAREGRGQVANGTRAPATHATPRCPARMTDGHRGVAWGVDAGVAATGACRKPGSPPSRV